MEVRASVAPLPSPAAQAQAHASRLYTSHLHAVAYSRRPSDSERLPHTVLRQIWQCTPLLHRIPLPRRPPPARPCFESACLHPRKGRILHGPTFAKMSFKFGWTWFERDFSPLAPAGKPSTLPKLTQSFSGLHFSHLLALIFVKASNESQSYKVDYFKSRSPGNRSSWW